MRLLGLMSGTSLDGIDAALLEVEEPEGGRERIPRIKWRLRHFLSHPFPPDRREEILRVLARGGARDLALLHTRIGEWLAEAALALLHTAGLRREEIAAIGSHGQTVWHEPPRGGSRGTSLQVGCPSTLAERTGIPVVSDFRARDLAAGGHGAPLVPWADAVFFSSPAGPRTIQNLGGMGNVTWLPPGGDPAGILAFDTGPGVALLDEAAATATAGAWRFDRDGALARQGTVREGVLSRLLSLPFFDEVPPRSTGREVFGPFLVAEAKTWLEAETGGTLTPGDPEEGWPDLLATLTALTARSVGVAYRRWVLPLGVDQVHLMGGGARNPALWDAIGEELAPLEMKRGEELGMDPDAREAAAFALLAWAHLRGFPGNIPGATGARGPRILGSLTPGAHR